MFNAGPFGRAARVPAGMIPDKSALWAPRDRLIWAGLWARHQAVRAGLAAQGVVAASIVAAQDLWIEDEIMLFFALASLGAVLLPLSADKGVAAEVLADVRPGRIVGAGGLAFETLLAGGPAPEPDQAPRWSMMVSQRSLVLNAYAVADALGLLRAWCGAAAWRSWIETRRRSSSSISPSPRWGLRST